MTKRLALYAHYGASPLVARHVLFYLEQLHRLEFQIGFISNSALSRDSRTELETFCSRIIVRENAGFDFSMWQRGLLEYDLASVDELLLTNSSIIGPLQPLETLWDNQALAGCDFWGLTDNNEIATHLQSYFIVFRRRVFQSPHFTEFWRSILPYRDKQQTIRSYEVGLTRWLEESGFKWKALFERERVQSLFLKQRGVMRRVRDQFGKQKISEQNTTTVVPAVLLHNGMPFLKALLLRDGSPAIHAGAAFELLKQSSLPSEVLTSLQSDFPEVNRKR